MGASCNIVASMTSFSSTRSTRLTIIQSAVTMILYDITTWSWDIITGNVSLEFET